MCSPLIAAGIGASALGGLLNQQAAAGADRKSRRAMEAERDRQRAMEAEGMAAFERSRASFAQPGAPGGAPGRDRAVAGILSRIGPGAVLGPVAPAHAGGAAMTAISTGMREGAGRGARTAASGRALHGFGDAQLHRRFALGRNALDLALLGDRSRRSAEIGQAEAAAAAQRRVSQLGDLLGVGGSLASLYGALGPASRPVGRRVVVGRDGRIAGGI